MKNRHFVNLQLCKIVKFQQLYKTELEKKIHFKSDFKKLKIDLITLMLNQFNDLRLLLRNHT